MPIQGITVVGLPLKTSDIWPHVALTPVTFTDKIQFWKDRPTFDAATFTRDLVRVDHFLHREGWHKISVTGTVAAAKKGRVNLTYHITVGAFTKIRNYWINAKELSAADTLYFRRHVSLTKGHRFREIELYQAADSLATIYRTHGYARAKVSTDVKWEPDSLWVTLNLIVDSGPICTFDTATVSGLSHLSANDITDDLLMEPGQQYSVSLIERSQRILYSRNVFRSVVVSADTSVPGNKLPVRVRVAEANRWQARVGGGWFTAQKWKAIGELTDRFLLAHGKIIKLKVDGSKQETNGSVGISFPHAIGPGSEFSVAPYVKRSQEFGYNAVGSKQTVTFLSGQWWTFQLAQDLQRSWKYDTANHAEDTTTSLVRNALSNRDLYTLTGIYDFRNDPFEATHGGVFSPEVSVSGILFPKSPRFFKFSCYGNYSITFDRKLTYATRFQVGALVPYGAYNAPAPEDLFYLGSPGLVRGWDYNRLSPGRDPNNNNSPIGGQRMIAWGFEIRTKVWGPLWWANFFDAGNVWSLPSIYGNSTTKMFPLMTSVGTGVRLKSPIGIVRFDVGWQTRKNSYGESRRPLPVFAIGEAI